MKWNITWSRALIYRDYHIEKAQERAEIEKHRTLFLARLLGADMAPPNEFGGGTDDDIDQYKLEFGQYWKWAWENKPKRH